MILKRAKSQVYRDPIYGYITVNYDLITKLINTKEFQRLRRIKQLSGVSVVYPSAEHTRFTHSLGVYHLATVVLNATSLNSILSERESLLFLTAALLHDIGHGPYSHAFEDVFKTNHEKIGAQIMVDSSTEVNAVLNIVDNEFASDVASIILKENKFPVLEQLISSQLDIDRLDYLVRDTYFTGAFYGFIDVDKIIRSIVIVDNKVVFKESGLSAIESYLISRYHMYNQVYFHKGVRAYELVLEKIYLRLKDLTVKERDQDLNLLKRLLNNSLSLQDYLQIDDSYINGLINKYQNADDLILQTLTKDFINRKMWESIKIENYHSDLIKDLTNDEIKYFTATKTAYEKAYQELTKDLANNIEILSDEDIIEPLSKKSNLINSLLTSEPNKRERFFYRK